MDFGKRLVEAREYLGFNQSEFSERIDLAAQSLTRYEKNKVKPSMEFIAKLTNMFNINANWLLTGKGEMLLKKDEEKKEEKQECQNATLSQEEQEMLEKFRKLPIHLKKAHIIEIDRDLLDEQAQTLRKKRQNNITAPTEQAKSSIA